MQDQNFQVSSLFTDDELIQLRASGLAVSNQYWAWGDFTARKADEIRARFGEHTGLVTRLYHYVASLIGKSERSVRLYAEVSRFFDPEIREVYGPLTYDTFKLAKSYGQDWRLVLDTAMGFVDSRGGRLPTREWLEMRLRPIMTARGGDMADQTPLPLDLEDVYRTADLLADAQPGPEAVDPAQPRTVTTVAVQVAIKAYASFTRQFVASVLALSLRSETRSRLQMAVDALDDAIKQIEEDVRGE